MGIQFGQKIAGMSRRKYTEAQIIAALNQVEVGATAEDVAREQRFKSPPNKCGIWKNDNFAQTVSSVKLPCGCGRHHQRVVESRSVGCGHRRRHALGVWLWRRAHGQRSPRIATHDHARRAYGAERRQSAEAAAPNV